MKISRQRLWSVNCKYLCFPRPTVWLIAGTKTRLQKKHRLHSFKMGFQVRNYNWIFQDESGFYISTNVFLAFLDTRKFTVHQQTLHSLDMKPCGCATSPSSSSQRKTLLWRVNLTSDHYARLNQKYVPMACRSLMGVNTDYQD